MPRGRCFQPADQGVGQTWRSQEGDPMSISNATQGRVGPRNLPPFRSDHVGSLLRPRELVEARAARKAGTLSAEALRVVEDRCIAAAIRKQEDCGLRAATDGEY